MKLETLLFLIPLLPFAGGIILAISGGRLSKTLTAIIGLGSVGLSALITIIIGISLFLIHNSSFIINSYLYTWIETGGFKADIAFHLDALSLCFIFIITFVGFLIHLYSAEFMYNEEGYSRFFAYMNLFVGSMLTLVLADNLLLLYLGWEGVGLCSYLLIGFWYKDPANDYAARKAFTITRIGDTAMIIALFILYYNFKTLNIHDLMTIAPTQWPVGSQIATLTALFLLGGALGKSAQLPLQTWLPDAMAGPSPVSALIHAATMVTAGVYLIARTNVLFALSPIAQTTVAVIGTLTLIIAGLAAMTQHDIKRVLAYSTISQIGYMFLALGIGAFSAGIFHFMIHAFFKALLFLAAGIVIIAQHEEHNMFKMGGLKNKLPIIYWTFLIGSASLAALPLITAGFYSKDAILWFAFAGKYSNLWLWGGAFLGAVITALYSFRMVFVTFHGEQKIELSYTPGWKMNYPLIILAVLSLIGGFIELPDAWGHVQLFSDFILSTLPPVHMAIESHSAELLLQLITGLLTLSVIYFTYLFFIKKKFQSLDTSTLGIQHLLVSGLGFDWLYDRIFVRPTVYLSEINKNDFIDKFFDVIALLIRFLGKQISKTQTGLLRNYALAIAIGVVIALTLIILIK